MKNGRHRRYADAPPYRTMADLMAHAMKIGNQTSLMDQLVDMANPIGWNGM